MRKFLNKLTCMAVSLTFLMGCMATPAFAYSSVESSEETTAPAIFETEEEPVTVTEQNTGPLTPEGNLTVVDDYQTTFSDGTAQQFITLVSKSGAYFYLIIEKEEMALDCRGRRPCSRDHRSRGSGGYPARKKR